MATQADLRSQILGDLVRGASFTSQVDQGIADAIRFYQPKRFYFNEKRTVTFSTVAGTDTYTFNTPTLTGTVGAEFYKIDQVLIQIGANWDIMGRVDYDWLEQVADNNTEQGQPYNYAYIDRAMRIYPIPGDIYTIRVIGHVKAAAPASDSEADNVWMNEAYELIRSRAKAQIAMHVLEDEGLAQRMAIMEKSALGTLRAETYRKTEGGMIAPTYF